MKTPSDFKLIKEKELDENTKVVIKKNLMSGRIFVEFSCTCPKLTLQKSFQETKAGELASKEFSKSISGTEELIKYFSK